MISNATKCSILRWIHIIFGIPILGYIYGPVSEVQQYTAAVRFVSFLPVIVLSGFGCGKAMSFDDLFRKDRPNTMLRRTAAPLGSRAIRIICERLLQPTGRFRRGSLSLRR